VPPASCTPRRSCERVRALARRATAFGCGSGIGEGSLALYRCARWSEYRSPAHLARARRTRPAAAAAALGIAVPRCRVAALAHLRARVAVVTHGFGDVNRFPDSAEPSSSSSGTEFHSNSSSWTGRHHSHRCLWSLRRCAACCVASIALGLPRHRTDARCVGTGYAATDHRVRAADGSDRYR
jgi:hypothetical protein